jgi:hypothetical protein
MVGNRLSRLQIAVLLLILALLLSIWPVVQWQRHYFYNRDSLHGKFIAQGKFLLGINYPWLNYGTDFGANSWGHTGLSDPDSRAVVEGDFSDLQSNGVRVVRWFLFCDGRAGIQINPDGTVKGLDPFVFKDMDAAVEIARKHKIMIVFVLFDYSMLQPAKPDPAAKGAAPDYIPVKLGGHREFVSNQKVRQTLLDNVVKPVLQRYGNDGAVVAWEVINEPEWVMSTLGSRKDGICVPDMQDFVRQVALLVHQNTAQVVTVGGADRRWSSVWKNVGLDFFQFHHYPYMEWYVPYDRPADDLGLNKPVLIGEFPTKGTNRSLSSYLDLALKNGYAGAFLWSYRATDKYTGWNSVRDQLSKWSAAHKDALTQSDRVISAGVLSPH